MSSPPSEKDPERATAVGDSVNGGAEEKKGEREEFLQNVVVMRHGDRIDNCEPMWISTAPRPWDPPLTEAGKIRAWCTGKKLRSKEHKIDRVLVSPFIRCIQTAAEVVSALCAVDEASLLKETSANVVLDPSKVKVSIEYGLCEMLSREAIRMDLIPKDGNWILEISELEAMLPAGTLDRSAERVYQEMPQWEEQHSAARHRYKEVIMALADKYPHENLLLVSHGEGVGVAVTAILKDMVVYEVEYCAYAHSQRLITFIPSGGFKAEDFKMLTKNGKTGICFYSREEDY
ncbi:uncharacterized protein LOC131248229 [Magnolia sinica]|uniref:uncharacterized protein LOC131248229 n=1 Tax=Magnolia sinica TaxID=86752 RepID=UPI002659EE68|nr:uncharacterized protein LOC131248229 [Magnolia sinica]